MTAPDTACGPADESTYADVILPRHLRRTFTYRVPAALHAAIRVGTHVRVPFGKGMLDAVVVALGATPGAGLRRPPGDRVPAADRLREIVSVLDGASLTEVPADVLVLSRVVADYYLAPWGQCVRLMLPPSSRKQAAVQRVRRPRAHAPLPPDPESVLVRPASQPESRPLWWPEYLAALARRRHATFLIPERAPRQWRIMLEAAGAALSAGRPTLILSPSIARAEALAGMARQQFGDQVLVWHSGLPPSARAEAWRRLAAGGALLAIGTRSLVFAPSAGLGLIAVDDEDDPAFKEETEPLYHAREVARMRAECGDAVLVLGSPHPSLETLVRLHALSPQVGGPAYVAPVHLVDLRRTPFGTLLTDPLQEAIQATLSVQDRAVLFLNRKGFAPALQCRDCGTSPSCPRCRVALTFFKQRGRLRCHYCGAAAALPDVCPDCRAARLEPSGIGTERVEELIRRLCPAARIERLDRDRARRPRDAEAIRRRFNEGSIDILIGTQMLVQGPPLRTVGLVGLIHADAGLHLPDFRAGERTYHGLLDAVSLARPDGRVILQTYAPSHPAIDAIAHNRPSLFYDQETACREALGYPPFASLISLRVTGLQPEQVREAAGRWAQRLARVAGREITILGPIPAPLAQLRGRHRWQLLVKSASGDAARRAVLRTLEDLEAGSPRSLKYEVDVDPVEMI